MGELRVIGINYQLVEEPVTTRAVAGGAQPKKSQPERTIPKPQRFVVRIRRTAIIDHDIPVEAQNRRSAEAHALEQSKNEPFDVAQAKVREEIVRAE
jgi:hypothetical protein